ncbi:MAG TPA: hypothetical protein VH143_19365 [Kofleriaceae bacterium]|jgi:hypothetical protein|nr:hypothetical protein [Kofleriaceae bacterium]
MRGFLLSAGLGVSFAIAASCGNSNHGTDICATTIPPPAACMTACDPTPGAPNTCPSGYHCDADGKCDAQCTQGGSQCGDGFMCTSDGQCLGSGQCTGIACQVAACDMQGQSPTTITGTVFAPNGTLPLYNVQVYIPNSDPGPFPDGVQCGRCDNGLPGDPIVQTTTDTNGNFTLSAIPSGSSIPVVITIGKWRRQITIPTVMDCTSTALAAADTTLPKSMSDMTPNTKSVDMPKVAISTGGADALECLVRKLGIADTEIGTAGGTQRVQLFADTMSGGEGASSFQTGFPGGSGPFADSQSLWNTTAALSAYDITILSCEGGQFSNTKSQAALTSLESYAEAGGRVFMSHWHNIWIEGATQDGTGQVNADWKNIAKWNDNGANTDGGANYKGNDTIDEGDNPDGNAFATWMLNVMGSTVRDQIVLQSGTGKSTAVTVDETLGQQWAYTASGGSDAQMFQFLASPPPNAPVGDASSACGKVVFSDMHVSGDSSSSTGVPYPGPGNGKGCSTAGLTPQEKALAFMFFDISACIGIIP